MHAAVTTTPARLPDLLLHVAVTRPVFIWGQPGIGKPSLIEEFAVQVGLECETLLGTQLAAEDLIGVPRIVGDGDQARSRFCPRI
jgi:MoxR-like ATPase